MSIYHFEKWLYKTILGFILVAGGVFFMYYSLSHFVRDDWILYGSICSAAVGIGTYLLSSGAINKVKSDIIKKQKAKQLN
jgi:protein-S-isoprenylcysteine O-methyltransferase Ste14